MLESEKHGDGIRQYYGKVLASARDLKTGACCPSEAVPERHRRIVGEIPAEILEKFYGCGSPIPEDVEGRTVLDLGCGSGRDAYVIAKLVGPGGRVIGVDMTPEQLATASRHVESQAKVWGFPRPNLSFRQGYIEALAEAGIADATVDVVVSNCVLNLSADKESAFREIFRVLKPGGELLFSDIFAGSRVPDDLQADPVLVGECLAGALYWEDFRRLLRKVGCLDYRILSRRRIALENGEIEARIGMVDFHSATIRAFKLADLEDICEDYGQTATYLGTLPEHPYQFMLDDHHRFRAHKPLPVCGNTASMLAATRFSRHFQVSGNRDRHFGPFPCGPAIAAPQEEYPGGCC